MQSQCAYLTGGLPLAVGDFVVVPVGNRNAEKTGRVTDVFVCSAQDAPYPPEKAKFVLRKSEQTAFPEKKTTPVEPAKNEKAATQMPPVPVEPPVAQSAPEEPASFEVEPVPEEPTFTLPPLPERDEPKKPKRRLPSHFSYLPCRRSRGLPRRTANRSSRSRLQSRKSASRKNSGQSRHVWRKKQNSCASRKNAKPRFRRKKTRASHISGCQRAALMPRARLARMAWRNPAGHIKRTERSSK